MNDGHVLERKRVGRTLALVAPAEILVALDGGSTSPGAGFEARFLDAEAAIGPDLEVP